MEDVLTVNNLKTYYYSNNKKVPAVDGVSFRLYKGEVLGIVGESGCGKSTIARSILNLLDKSYTKIEDGEILFHGSNLLQLKAKELNRIKGKKISMIFQNPQAALNPVYTVGDQIAEVLRLHENISKKEVKARVIELLRLVGIPAPETRLNDYPHQMSGGMQQRILIAIALACNPEVVIADEPTTALDVTIQAQILDLMTRIKQQFQMGMILITHNMGVVAEMCDRMMVMYGGVVVEEGATAEIFAAPSHPYTQGLLASIPSIEEDREELYSIPGSVPRLSAPVTHCRFAGRCPHSYGKCEEVEPPLFDLGNGHKAKCWLLEDKAGRTHHE
ncbi:ABC transporter ATP-binding protein [Paenibacillus sp. CGMCC 1.16610]|uniref:ATP-binding cassette domain-containing protein n=1 Tax=Paenibacillus anseongense TaxID=2682845 RepID=A0ABW9U7P0_9BACL|nr:MULTISPECIES: ABC transporter ATP-binding protein [Paenibacillus]MBA2940279.1 ABC transporter ATP-binding protein [Paenibacillus sp. CGMCC 1.16610]MVQ35456.1 ATP-binding cassette domain-containing protein [Paenibacillus anseongense]